MEKLVLIISFLFWSSGEHMQERDNSFSTYMCQHKLQVQCGQYDDPRGSTDDAPRWIECGFCPGQTLCGGAVPNPDGTDNQGTPGMCGGGCVEVSSFSCQAGTATMCTVASMPPHEDCANGPDLFSWCC